jgi:hypothetical protein
MTSEEQLILLLGRGQLPSDSRRQALPLLASPLDWDLIVERVLAEGVDPLFFRNLEALSLEQGAGSGEQEQGAWSAEQGAGKDIADCELRDVEWQGAQSERDQRATLNAINVRNAINVIDQTSEVSDERSDVGGRGNAKNSERNNAKNSINATNANNATNAINASDATNAIERLRGLSKINAFRNTLLVEELARVLKLFAEAGIPAIPLKGPALAQALYGDPSLRTCVDLDILVPRSMVRRAFDLLCADGYESEFAPGFFSDLLLRHDIEYALRRDDRGFEYMVELHWGVLWGGKLEESVTDQLWADAYPTTAFGSPAYALSAEWLILVLAAHAARHQWHGLKWLIDLHELYSAPKFDWAKLQQKARQLGWEELLRISFLACHSLFQTPIPEKYLVGELPSWVKLFPESAPANLSGAFFATRFLTRTSDKLRYIARVLLVPTLAEWRLIALPSFLSPLYYPLRPLRLMCKWSWGFLAGSTEHGVNSWGRADSRRR